MIGAGTEFNSMSLIDSNTKCFDLPSMWYKNTGNGMVDFGYQNDLNWTLPNSNFTDNISLFTRSCPLKTRGGGLNSCECCQEAGDLDNQIISVLYNEDNLDTTMDDCLCFEAVNVSCAELSSSFFRKMNVASFVLCFVIFSSSFLITLMTLKEFFVSVEERTTKLAAKARMRDKQKRLESLRGNIMKSKWSGRVDYLRNKFRREAPVLPD